MKPLRAPSLARGLAFGLAFSIGIWSAFGLIVCWAWPELMAALS